MEDKKCKIVYREKDQIPENGFIPIGHKRSHEIAFPEEYENKMIVTNEY